MNTPRKPPARPSYLMPESTGSQSPVLRPAGKRGLFTVQELLERRIASEEAQKRTIRQQEDGGLSTRLRAGISGAEEVMKLPARGLGYGVGQVLYQDPRVETLTELALRKGKLDSNNPIDRLIGAEGDLLLDPLLLTGAGKIPRIGASGRAAALRTSVGTTGQAAEATTAAAESAASRHTSVLDSPGPIPDKILAVKNSHSRPSGAEAAGVRGITEGPGDTPLGGVGGRDKHDEILTWVGEVENNGIGSAVPNVQHPVYGKVDRQRYSPDDIAVQEAWVRSYRSDIDAYDEAAYPENLEQAIRRPQADRRTVRSRKADADAMTWYVDPATTGRLNNYHAAPDVADKLRKNIDFPAFEAPLESGVGGLNLSYPEANRTWINQQLADEHYAQITAHEKNHQTELVATSRNTSLLPELYDELSNATKPLTEPVQTSSGELTLRQIEYLQRPGEMYSRLGEIRNVLGKKPGEHITLNELNEALPKVNHHLFVTHNPVKLHDIINKAPALLPAAAAMKTNKKSTTKEKFGLGGLLKKVGNLGHDYGLGVADFATSAVGMSDVIGKDQYRTGAGRFVDGYSKVAAPIALQVGGSALGVPPQVTSGVQAAGTSINQNQQAMQQLGQQQGEALRLQRQQWNMPGSLPGSVPTSGVTGSGYYAAGGMLPELPQDGSSRRDARRAKAARLAQFSPAQNAAVQQQLQVTQTSQPFANPNDYGLPLGTQQFQAPVIHRNSYGEIVTAPAPPVAPLPAVVGTGRVGGDMKGSLAKFPRFAGGGSVPGAYEVEEGEVVQGDAQLANVDQNLASDLQLVGGQSHEQGGVDGVGGERVYSDRLKPVGSKFTYAELAVKVGRKKGKFEQKQEFDRDPIARATTARMSGRLDQQLDVLFEDQEMNKPARAVGAGPSFAKGGALNYRGWDPVGARAGQGMAGSPFQFTSGRTDYAGWDPTGAKTGMDTGMMNMLRTPQIVPGYDPLQGMNTIPGGTATGGGLDAAGIAGSILPFADNITNAFLKTPAVPAPILTSAPRLNTNVTVNPQLSALRREREGLRQSIMRNSSSGASARSSAIAADVQGQGAVGEVIGQGLNQSRELFNHQQLLDYQTQTQNNQTLNQFQGQQRDAVIDQQGRTSQNVANASLKMQGMELDRRKMEADLTRLKILAPVLGRTGALGRADGKVIKELLKKYPSLSAKDAQDLLTSLGG